MFVSVYQFIARSYHLVCMSSFYCKHVEYSVYCDLQMFKICLQHSCKAYTQGLPSEVGDEALMNLATDSTFESHILTSTPARTMQFISCVATSSV